MQKDIERGLAAGFTDYLVKPLDLRRFQTALDNALSVVSEDENPHKASVAKTRLN
jgi:response regulator of citrate/malate metabolism